MAALPISRLIQYCQKRFWWLAMVFVTAALAVGCHFESTAWTYERRLQSAIVGLIEIEHERYSAMDDSTIVLPLLEPINNDGRCALVFSTGDDDSKYWNPPQISQKTKAALFDAINDVGETTCSELVSWQDIVWEQTHPKGSRAPLFCLHEIQNSSFAHWIGDVLKPRLAQTVDNGDAHLGYVLSIKGVGAFLIVQGKIVGLSSWVNAQYYYLNDDGIYEYGLSLDSLVSDVESMETILRYPSPWLATYAFNTSVLSGVDQDGEAHIMRWWRYPIGAVKEAEHR